MALRLDIETLNAGAFHLELDHREVIIGRSAACEVRLPYPAISNRHVRLTKNGTHWSAIDLQSKNGTLLNGRPIPVANPVNVPPGARLQLSPDVIVIVNRERESTEGFTLTETHTLLRKLLADTDAAETGAYLESANGERVDVPDSASNLRAGENAAFVIDRRGHGFWLTPVGTVTANGEEVPVEGIALHDGMQLQSPDVRWTFHDPLQARVQALDDASAPGEENETFAAAAPAPRRTTMEWLLLSVGVITAACAGIALLVIFEII